MGNEQYDTIKAALAAHGLMLRKIDGRWETVEKPGGISGLPEKLKEIRIKFVEKKPKGSPGRGPSAGFNLQATLAMSDSDYDLVYADAKVILHRTHGIKMNEPIMKQDRTIVDHAIKKLVAVHTEFEVYRKVGLWPARAFFQMILRVRSNKYRTSLKNPDVVKTRKRRGKAPAMKDKAPVPTGEPAIAGPQAPEGNPADATHPASGALQGEDDDDDAETFNLEGFGDDDDDDDDPFDKPGPRDVTMNEATRLNVNLNATVNMSCDRHDDDDNDGGAFDMSQTTGLTLVPQTTNTGVPPAKTAPAQSDRPLAPPVDAARAPASTTCSSAPSSAAPTKSSSAPTSNPPGKSASLVKSHIPTPPPPPSPPPPSPTSSSAHAAAPKSKAAGTAPACRDPLTRDKRRRRGREFLSS